MRYIAHILFIILFCLLGNTLKANAATIPQKDSVVNTYHDNGKVKEKQKYKNGKKHGRWITYDENGAILKIVKYKKGEFWWERLYKKGKISKITDRNGKVTKMKDCGC